AVAHELVTLSIRRVGRIGRASKSSAMSLSWMQWKYESSAPRVEGASDPLYSDSANLEEEACRARWKTSGSSTSLASWRDHSRPIFSATTGRRRSRWSPHWGGTAADRGR